MPFDMQTFCSDLMTMPFDALTKIYWRKIPSTVTLKDTMAELERRNGYEVFVKDATNSTMAEDLYFVRVNKGYEVFMSERGAHHYKRHFIHIAPACSYYLDLIFHQLGHLAPDSTIVTE